LLTFRNFLPGGKNLPDRAVAVTFDDGYADNYENAAPVLDRFGVPGAFYATIKNVETLHSSLVLPLAQCFSREPEK
jgi:peptidoglycan/xylan/chitin deacetylase (PgdA/CDA1 family)